MRMYAISLLSCDVPLDQARQKPLILLVEDNEDDVYFIRRAFKRAAVDNRLQTVRSGSDAVAYLKGDPPYWNRDEYPLPTLVLLDIKMPGTDGFEVLKWIRQQQPQFARLCVVMLTSSDEIRDVNRAYQLGATSFLVKPLDFWNAADLSRVVDRLLAKGECSASVARPEPGSRL